MAALGTVPNRRRKGSKANPRGRKRGTAGYAKSKAFAKRIKKMSRKYAKKMQKFYPKARSFNGKKKNGPFGRSTAVTWTRKPNRRPLTLWGRKANPETGATFIGRAPTLTVSGHGHFQFPRGVLRAAPDKRSVYLDLGGDKAPPVGSRVTRVEYDDPVKAVEAYKEIGRFRHDCADPFIVGPAAGGTVLLSSKSIAWKRE